MAATKSNESESQLFNAKNVAINLPSLILGGFKMRFIMIDDEGTFRLSNNIFNRCGLHPLFLGVDVLQDVTDSKNRNRVHARFVYMGLAAKLEFTGCRLHGIPRGDMVYFYSVHGLFKAIFEYHQSRVQRDCLQQMMDAWIQEYNELFKLHACYKVPVDTLVTMCHEETSAQNNSHPLQLQAHTLVHQESLCGAEDSQRTTSLNIISATAHQNISLQVSERNSDASIFASSIASGPGGMDMKSAAAVVSSSGPEQVEARVISVLKSPLVVSDAGNDNITLSLHEHLPEKAKRLHVNIITERVVDHNYSLQSSVLGPPTGDNTHIVRDKANDLACSHPDRNGMPGLVDYSTNQEKNFSQFVSKRFVKINIHRPEQLAATENRETFMSLPYRHQQENVIQDVRKGDQKGVLLDDADNDGHMLYSERVLRHSVDESGGSSRITLSQPKVQFDMMDIIERWRCEVKYLLENQYLDIGETVDHCFPTDDSQRKDREKAESSLEEDMPTILLLKYILMVLDFVALTLNFTGAQSFLNTYSELFKVLATAAEQSAVIADMAEEWCAVSGLSLFKFSALVSVSRWLGEEFHKLEPAITQRVTSFKHQHINSICELPPAREVVDSLFPPFMVILARAWVGAADSQEVVSEDVQFQHNYYSSNECKKSEAREGARPVAHCHWNIDPLIQLVLELLCNSLVSGTAHVVYCKLRQAS